MCLNFFVLLLYVHNFVHIMKTTSVSDFRTHLKKYLDAVILNSDSVVINRGNTGAVLISIEEYNSIKGTENIVSSEILANSVKTGLDEISRGEIAEVDIESL